MSNNPFFDENLFWKMMMSVGSSHEIKIEEPEPKPKPKTKPALDESIKSYILNGSRAYKCLTEEDYYALTYCKLINNGETLYISIGQLGVSKPNVIIIRFPTKAKSFNDIKVDFINDSGSFSASRKILGSINVLIDEIWVELREFK